MAESNAPRIQVAKGFDCPLGTLTLSAWEMHSCKDAARAAAASLDDPEQHETFGQALLWYRISAASVASTVSCHEMQAPCASLVTVKA